PAIRYARDGFVVSNEYVSMAGYRAELLKRWPDSARIFLQNGEAPKPGFRLVQEDLARLFENVAKYGASYFYHGEFARRLVDGVRAAGGNWTVADLANYSVREREPV